MFNSKVYSLSNNTISLKNTFTNIQAYSPSLEYIVSNGALFGLVNGTYSDLKVNLASYTSYKVINYLNQFIIYGFNSTSLGNGTYNIYQTAYVGVCSNGQCNLFSNFTVNSTNSSLTEIFLSTSPQMTKIHYQYYNGTSIGVEFLQVDFTKKTLKSITFTSKAKYLTTTNNISLVFNQGNYFLG